ncbi:MAG TPA: hypothetical protein VL172_14305 [Kofleriaceae bacterium]|nr:hypothetical protein [Kofleriaceae bacterium]
MRALLTCLLLAAAAPARAGAPAAEAPPRVRHLPLASAEVDHPVLVTATVDRAWKATLEIHYRSAEHGPWRAAPFELDSHGGYQATIPADAARPPGFEYYIESVGRDGARVAHFASAAEPHRVLVLESTAQVDRRRELAVYRNRRARAETSFEWVDFGRRQIEPGVSVPDHYYRIDVAASFRVLRLPLHTLRFGYTRLLGTTPETERGAGSCTGGLDPDPDCRFRAGMRAGGWVELRMRLLRVLDVDARGMVEATQDGFNVGTRDELRIGSDQASHVALGVEAIADIGTSVYFRLGWDTVRQLPMAATIELTDFPASHRATGLRLVYDIAHPMDNGLRIGLRAGYQARDQRIGGVTLGGSLALDFDFGGGTR